MKNKIIKYNDSKTYNINYNNHYQLNKNNSLISDYNSYTINSFNLNKITNDYNYKKYCSNTSNSMSNPSNNYSKMVKKVPGKILTIEINFIGAALSNGIIFPFKKTSNMRLKEKKNRLRSISNNSSYSEINIDCDQSNLHYDNNYSHNTYNIYHSNLLNDDYYNNNGETIEYENNNINNYYNYEKIGIMNLNILEPNNYNQSSIKKNTL